jgi:hypothetical protein
MGDYMKFIKLSIRDSASPDAVDPKDFNSENLLEPHKVNNIHIVVENLYYLGYNKEKDIMDQLKLRGIEANADTKKIVKETLEHLNDSKEQAAPSFKVTK